MKRSTIMGLTFASVLILAPVAAQAGGGYPEMNHSGYGGYGSYGGDNEYGGYNKHKHHYKHFSKHGHKHYGHKHFKFHAHHHKLNFYHHHRHAFHFHHKPHFHKPHFHKPHVKMVSKPSTASGGSRGGGAASHGLRTPFLASYTTAWIGCSVVGLMTGSIGRQLSRREAHYIVGNCLIPFFGGDLFLSLMKD